MLISTFFIFLQPAALFFIGSLLLYGAIKDIFHRSVPNFISGFIFLLSWSVTIADYRIVDGFLSFSIVSTLSIILYYFNVFGGADAKILMALSALIPFELLPLYGVILSLFLFIVTLFYLLLVLMENRLGRKRLLSNTTIPFFVPVSACYFFVSCYIP